ncbi:multicopper oxidase domain-containing protein [Sulfitobacter sp.]
MVNDTAFPHGIHLHGHHFWETDQNGARTHLRDTTLVAPGETMTIQTGSLGGNGSSDGFVPSEIRGSAPRTAVPKGLVSRADGILARRPEVPLEAQGTGHPPSQAVPSANPVGSHPPQRPSALSVGSICAIAVIDILADDISGAVTAPKVSMRIKTRRKTQVIQLLLQPSSKGRSSDIL